MSDKTTKGGRGRRDLPAIAEEARRVARIVELRDAGMSLRDIREALESEGLMARVPYGYRVSADGRTIEEHAGEQMVLAAVRELRAAGLSVKEVMRELEDAGLYARADKGGKP